MPNFLDWVLRRRTKLRQARGALNTGRVGKRRLGRELAQMVPCLTSGDQGQQVIDALHILMARHLDEGREVAIKGWGRYFLRKVPALTKKLPSSETKDIPERTYPYWLSSKTLKVMIDR